MVFTGFFRRMSDRSVAVAVRCSILTVAMLPLQRGRTIGGIHLAYACGIHAVILPFFVCSDHLIVDASLSLIDVSFSTKSLVG